MATSDKNNVTKRSDVNRAMTYQEGDANFDELKNVIDDAHANEQNLSDHENAGDPHPQYMTESETDSKVSEHEAKVDPHPQYATDTKVDGIDIRLIDRENELDDVNFGLDRRVIYVDTIADLQALDTSGLVAGQAAVVHGSELRWDGSTWMPMGAVNVAAFGAVANSSLNQDSALTAAHAFADSFGVPVEYNQGFYTADIFEKPWTSKTQGNGSTWRVNGTDIAIPENDTTTGSMEFYVDAVNGNDLTGNGVSPSAPYKTIQAAWESAPSHLKHYCTMQLADGDYRESTIPGTDQARPAVLRGKGKTTSIRSYLSGTDIVSALTIKGNAATPGNVTITTDAEHTYGLYFNKGNIGLQDLTITASTAADFLLVSHRTDTYVHCSNVFVDGVLTGRTKYGVIAESGGQIEFVDGGSKNSAICVGSISEGCLITIAAREGQTIISGGNQGVLASSGGGVSLNALKDGAGKTQIINNCTDAIQIASGGFVSARGQDSTADMIQIESVIRVNEGSLYLTFAETLSPVVAENSRIRYSASNFQGGIDLFASDLGLGSAKSYVSPSTQNDAVRPVSIYSGSRVFYEGTNDLVGSSGLPASYNVTQLAYTADNQVLSINPNRDRYLITADAAITGAEISSDGVEEGRIIYLIGYGNQVTFNGSGTHMGFADNITIGNASGNLTGAILMMNGGKWRIVSVGDVRS